MKLTRIQRNALKLCIKMADRCEIINAKTFGIRYKEKSPATFEGKSNTGASMLMKLVYKGYLEKIVLSYNRNHYIVLLNPDRTEYVPIDAGVKRC